VPPDDILDAAAAAWSAWRCVSGKAEVMSGSDNGLSIADRGVIWF